MKINLEKSGKMNIICVIGKLKTISKKPIITIKEFLLACYETI